MAKGFAELVLEGGVRAVSRAAQAVLSDPRGQEALARAAGLAQRGMQMFEAAQEKALHAAGIAARPDYHELRKQVARLKRKARELSEALAGEGEPDDDADALDPEGADGGGTPGAGSR